jgi:hypothetical protein
MHAFAQLAQHRTVVPPKAADPAGADGVEIKTATPAGAVQARLDETLNRSARVAFAHGLGHALNQGPRPALHAHLAQLVTHKARPQRRAAFSTAPDAAPIQRMVQIDPEVVTRDRNVAVSWKGMPSYADTYAVINGKRIPPTANKAGLIKPPEFDFIPHAQQFQLQLTVPTQVVTSLLELPNLPESGHWELAGVTVGEIDAFVGAHGGKPPGRSVQDKEQPCTLIVEPDGNLADKIESHERHHLQDNLDAVKDILVPWDAALQDSKGAADQLVGRGPLELLAAYDEIGPPENAQAIADRLVARIKELGEAYHETEQGQPPVITGVALDKGRMPWQYRIRLKLEKT